MMKHFCDVLFNCLTTYSLDNTWIIVIIVLAVLLFSTLIAILIFSTRKIKKLKNNVKQLTNYNEFFEFYSKFVYFIKCDILKIWIVGI